VESVNGTHFLKVNTKQIGKKCEIKQQFSNPTMYSPAGKKRGVIVR